MRYISYAEYVESEIEWLGQIPSHWRVHRLKNLLRAPLKYGANEAAELDDPTLPRFIRITDITEEGGLRSTTFRSLPMSIARDYLLKDGDILFARSGATVGKTFLYRDSWGVCSYAGYLIRARFNLSLVLPSFIWYLTNTHYYSQWLSANSIQATIQNVSAERYEGLSCPCPTLQEQHAITSFLDRKTSHIDALLTRKLKLIELLQEKRSVLISQTVTKGLPPDAARAAEFDPHPKMKHSGVEWLGEVPEHWDILQLRHVCHLQTGDKDTVDAVDDGQYPFFVRSQIVERINSFSYVGEAVLTAGDGVGVGRVFHHYDGAFDYHQRVYMMNRFRRVSGRYFFYYLREQFYKVALEGNAKSTVDSLRRPMLLQFPITVVSYREQEAIVNYLDQKIFELDSLVDRVEEAVRRLQEYRASLINAAITGVIDIRNQPFA